MIRSTKHILQREGVSGNSGFKVRGDRPHVDYDNTALMVIERKDLIINR